MLPAQAPPRAGRPHGHRARTRSPPRRTSWRTRSPMPWPASGRATCPARRSTARSPCACRPRPTGRSPRRNSHTRPVGAIETPVTRRLSLAAWRVPVLVFAPAAASALAALAELPPGDIVTSGSIGYLAAVVRFADDLAARGRVLPVLTEEDDGYAARWRPVLSAADARHARELAAAMPPACRSAAASTGTDSAAGAAPGRCSRTCSTPSRTYRCAPGCLVRCCPRAKVAAPPVSMYQNGCCLL